MFNNENGLPKNYCSFLSESSNLIAKNLKNSYTTVTEKSEKKEGKNAEINIHNNFCAFIVDILFNFVLFKILHFSCKFFIEIQTEWKRISASA